MRCDFGWQQNALEQSLSFAEGYGRRTQRYQGETIAGSNTNPGKRARILQSYRPGHACETLSSCCNNHS